MSYPLATRTGMQAQPLATRTGMQAQLLMMLIPCYLCGCITILLLTPYLFPGTHHTTVFVSEGMHFNYAYFLVRRMQVLFRPGYPALPQAALLQVCIVCVPSAVRIYSSYMQKTEADRSILDVSSIRLLCRVVTFLNWTILYFLLLRIHVPTTRKVLM
jgi:hypothetical protein